MKKKGIILFRDLDGYRYAKHDEKELIKVMESLLTVFDSYVKFGAIENYESFFNNPIEYMTCKYHSIWNDCDNGFTLDKETSFFNESGLRKDEVLSLVNKFNRFYSYLGDLAPTITKNEIKNNLKASDFDIYCDKNKEKEYRALLSFVRAVKTFESHFPTQSRQRIVSFTGGLLDKNLHPKYSKFVEYISN